MNFDWGYGPITNYGRVYFSIRWWGKIKPMTTEEYTFYVTADWVRFFVINKMIIANQFTVEIVGASETLA